MRLRTKTTLGSCVLLVAAGLALHFSRPAPAEPRGAAAPVVLGSQGTSTRALSAARTQESAALANALQSGSAPAAVAATVPSGLTRAMSATPPREVRTTPTLSTPGAFASGRGTRNPMPETWADVELTPALRSQLESMPPMRVMTFMYRLEMLARFQRCIGDTPLPEGYADLHFIFEVSEADRFLARGVKVDLLETSLPESAVNVVMRCAGVAHYEQLVQLPFDGHAADPADHLLHWMPKFNFPISDDDWVYRTLRETSG